MQNIYIKKNGGCNKKAMEERVGEGRSQGVWMDG